MSTPARLAVLAGCLSLAPAPAHGDGPPPVREFITTYGDGGQFYRVRFEKPASVLLPAFGDRRPQALARLPRLVCDDPRGTGLSLLPAEHLAFMPGPLEFVGRWPADAPKKAGFRLRYATPGKADAGDDPFDGCHWVEQPVALVVEDARPDYSPPGDRSKPLRVTDVVGLWAAAQQAEFARLAAEAPDFPFYPFAQVALSRRYELPPLRLAVGTGERQAEYRDVFELLTGSASIIESLQSRRLAGPPPPRQARTIPIEQVRGIDLAQHPWDEMMGQRRPADEPLARLIPADNYYARFGSVGKLLAVGDWVDLWGGNLLNAFDYRTRDHRLRERYERQLCVPLERLAGALPKGLVVELAVTGSDPFFREGTDVTAVFRVTDAARFLALVEPFVEEARQAHRGRWREAREERGRVTIETFATPDREVSLHRARFDEFVVLSNSPEGLRRVLDAASNKAPALAAARDFRYMRTCFRADDPEEDAFAFLPDDFIRRLVSPAVRITQSRRAEALAAVGMAADAAMLAGWLGEPAPANLADLRTAARLRVDELQDAQGYSVEWDAKRQQAGSILFGNQRFATPLIELAIDKVTPAEAAAYNDFRDSYLRLWSRFSDPVGIRFREAGGHTRVEAYILPVIRSTEYDQLRRLFNDGTVTLDAADLTPETVLFFTGYVDFAGLFSVDRYPSQVLVRLEDSPLFKELADETIRAEREGRGPDWASPRLARAVLQLPLVLGLRGKAVEPVKKFLPTLRELIRADDIDERYHGVTVFGRRLAEDEWLTRRANPQGTRAEFRPTYYYAEIDEGLYFSFRQEPIKQLIDRHLERKNGKREPRGEKVNVALLAAPHGAPQAREAVNRYLEWQTHRRALAGNAVWYALHRAGYVPDNAREEDAALQRLGYVPVSPDGSPHLYDKDRDEVFNRRHGSFRQPQLRPTLAVNAPLRSLLETFRTVRMDLRFREDGIHTTLTWERQPAR